MGGGGEGGETVGGERCVGCLSHRKHAADPQFPSELQLACPPYRSLFPQRMSPQAPASHLFPVRHQALHRLLHGRVHDHGTAQGKLHAVVLMPLVDGKVVGDGGALLVRQLAGTAERERGDELGLGSGRCTLSPPSGTPSSPRVAHPAMDAAAPGVHPQDVLEAKVLPEAPVNDLRGQSGDASQSGGGAISSASVNTEYPR